MEAPNVFIEVLSAGETAEAIRILYQLVAERGDREAEHQLIIIHFDFRENERAKENGLRSHDRLEEVYNRVNAALLSLYDTVKGDSPSADAGAFSPVDEEFKTAIVLGNLNEAIQMLDREIEARGNEKAEQSLLLMQADYQEIKRDTMIALSSDDELRIRNNRLIRNLLTLREDVYALSGKPASEAARRMKVGFKELIAKGDLKKAIDWLKSAAEKKGDTGLREEIIITEREIAELREHRVLATLDEANLRIRRNRVISKLMALHQQLEEKEAFSITEDHAIKRWSLNGELLSGLGGPKASITSLSVAADWVLSTDKRGNYKVYENGKSVSTQGSRGSIAKTAAFFPSGNVGTPLQPRNYLVGGQEGVIRTYKPRGKLVNEVDLKESPIISLAISPDGEKLLVSAGSYFARTYTKEGELVRLLGTNRELFRTTLFGKENADAVPFLRLLPPYARLTSLVIRDGTLIDNITIKYRAGKEEGELTIGGTDKKANEEFYINAPISKITGRAGDDLDQLQFHFKDGTKTPVYGGNGGKPFELTFDDMDFVGFHGQASSRGWISQLGFFGRLKPEEPLRKAKRKT